jgi:hypothetical protein
MICLTCPEGSRSINVHGQSALEVIYSIARVVAMGISKDVAEGSAKNVVGGPEKLAQKHVVSGYRRRSISYRHRAWAS